MRGRAVVVHHCQSINYLRLISSTGYCSEVGASALDVIGEQFVAGALFDDPAEQFTQRLLLLGR